MGVDQRLDREGVGTVPAYPLCRVTSWHSAAWRRARSQAPVSSSTRGELEQDGGERVVLARTAFAEDIAIRRYGEQGNNIVHWSDFDRGGHFAAIEAPTSSSAMCASSSAAADEATSSPREIRCFLGEYYCDPKQADRPRLARTGTA